MESLGITEVKADNSLSYFSKRCPNPLLLKLHYYACTNVATVRLPNTSICSATPCEYCHISTHMHEIMIITDKHDKYRRVTQAEVT